MLQRERNAYTSLDVVASIVRGLTAAGYRVAAGKVTGTGAGGDFHMFVDAGATRVLDFTDFGFSSTYLLDSVTVTAAELRELTCADAPEQDPLPPLRPLS